MFEDLDRALLRENNKLNISALQPMVVSNVDDIKRVLTEIDPKNTKAAPEIELAALLNSIEDGKNNVYRVTTTTRSKSKREMLLEGMSLVKRQMDANNTISNNLEPIEVNGVIMKPPKFGKGGRGETWVDPLIRQWLGGYRDGLVICWDLNGYQYRYDIYKHTLGRIKNEK